MEGGLKRERGVFNLLPFLREQEVLEKEKEAMSRVRGKSERGRGEEGRCTAAAELQHASGRVEGEEEEKKKESRRFHPPSER